MSNTPTPPPTAPPAAQATTPPDGSQPPVIQVVQVAPQPAPIVQGMDESPVEGGYYIVGGQPVDAEGRPAEKRA